MKKMDFIEKIAKLFDDFTDKNIKARIEAYSIVLRENLDYDKLFDLLLKTYKSFYYAPSAAVLYELQEKILHDELCEKEEKEAEKRIAQYQKELEIQKEKEKEEERKRLFERHEPTEEEKARVKQLIEKLKVQTYIGTEING